MSDFTSKLFTKENLLSRDRVGAMIFLILCLCYGYQTSLIPMFPGDEYEPFTARTLPTILTFVGIGLSVLLLITGQPDQKSAVEAYFNWKSTHWFLGSNGGLWIRSHLPWLCISNQLFPIGRVLSIG
ncbi:tricarboxylate transport protein TctB [Vibrio variabilis]|uniref:Tricarboxylate transport protein TctB n=1 Tax=Vibrio variabilis TaxID=990271 RepID=A0ABQ0JRG8_9VIBR|nr:tricarboxylate transport protein TctB [Vibrio variabilis]